MARCRALLQENIEFGLQLVGAIVFVSLHFDNIFKITNTIYLYFYYLFHYFLFHCGMLYK